jgi:GTP-binding protein
MGLWVNMCRDKSSRGESFTNTEALVFIFNLLCANPRLYNSTMPNITNPRFYITVAKITGLERSNLPEIAFAGRSNAGKSSAINAICARKKLAFSSRTPGRTQALNFFSLDDKEGVSEAYLVDMPGYGYAQAPQELKKSWDDLAGKYLQVRGNLVGVVLIVDIRRGLGDLDRQLIQWAPLNVPVLIVLSKADKLGQQDRMKALLALRKQAGFEGRQVYSILFSVLAKIGIEHARNYINYFFNPIGEPPPLPTGSRRPEANLEMAKKNPSDNSARVECLDQAPAQGGEAGSDP